MNSDAGSTSKHLEPYSPARQIYNRIPDITFPVSYSTIAFSPAVVVPGAAKPRMRSPAPDFFGFLDDDALPAPSAPDVPKRYQDLDWASFMFEDDAVAEQILHGANTYGVEIPPETAITYTSAHGQRIVLPDANAEAPDVPLSSAFHYSSNDPGPSRHAGPLSLQNASLPPTVAYALDWGSDQNSTVGGYGGQLPSLTGPIRTQIGRIKRRKVQQSTWSMISDGYLLKKGPHY